MPSIHKWGQGDDQLKSFEEWIRSKEIAPIPMEREKSKWENENEGGKFY